MAKSYSYNGTEVSEIEINEAAAGFNMEVNEYIETFGVDVVEIDPPKEAKKQEVDKQEPVGKPQDTQQEDAPVVSENTASDSEDSLLESTTPTDPPSELTASAYLDRWNSELYKAQENNDTKLQEILEKEKDGFDRAVANNTKFYITRDNEKILVYDPEIIEKENIELQLTEEEEAIEEPEVEVALVGEDQDQLNVMQAQPEAIVEGSVFESDEQKNIVEKISAGDVVTKSDLTGLDIESVEDLSKDEIEKLQITNLYQSPEGQKALQLEKEIGADKVQNTRIINDPDYIGFKGEDGTTFSTPEAQEFELVTTGEFETQLGIKTVNVFAGPGAIEAQEAKDKAIERDKERIANASLMFIPEELRPSAVELRGLYKELDDLTDVTSESVSKILSEGGDVNQLQAIANQALDIEKKIDKVLTKNNRKLKDGTVKLYDYSTGKFVKEDEANQEVVKEINTGANEYTPNSIEKLEELRYQKALELIHLAGLAHDDFEDIFELGKSEYLKNSLTGGEEAIDLGATVVEKLGGKDLGATYTYEKFLAEREKIVSQGVDFTGLDGKGDGGLLYDDYMLEQVSKRKTLTAGMTTIPPVTLAAQRYNDALKEFTYINRALELNIDEVNTSRDTIVDRVLQGLVTTVSSQDITTQRDEKTKIAEFERTVIGGSDEYWEDIYNEIGGGEDTYHWWRDRFENIAGGAGPFLAIMLEFYLAGGALKAAKGSKAAKGVTDWWSNLKNSEKFAKWNGYKYYNNFINPANSRLGSKFNKYGSAIFEEYLTIKGVNYLNEISGQEDIHESFAVGAGFARAFMDDMAKFLANRGSKTFNSLVDVYKDNPTIGGILKGAVEPLVGVLTINIGESGSALFEGDLDKLSDIWNFDKAFELYITLWGAKMVRTDALSEISNSMKSVYDNIATKVTGKTKRIREAAKRLKLEGVDFDANDQVLTTVEIEKAYEKRVKEIQEKGGSKKELQEAALDKAYLNLHLDFKFLEAQFEMDNANSEKTLADVNRLADDILKGDWLNDYRNIDKIIKFTGTENTKQLLINKLKTKQDLTKQELTDIITEVDNISSSANRIEKELNSQNYSEKDKAKVYRLWLENYRNDQLIATIQDESKTEFDEVVRKNDLDNALNKKEELLKKLSEIQTQQEINRQLEVETRLQNLDAFKDISNKNFEVLSDNEFQEKLDEDGAKLVVAGVVTVEGDVYFNRNNITGKGVVGHEVFHKIERNNNWQELSKEQKDQLVEDFKKALTFEEQAIVEEYIKNTKAFKNNPNTTEWFNYYVEAVGDGLINPRYKKSEVEFKDVDLNNINDFKKWLDNFSVDTRESAIKDYIKESFKKAETDASEGKLVVDEEQVFSEVPKEVGARVDNIFEKYKDVWSDVMFNKNSETSSDNRTRERIFGELVTEYQGLIDKWTGNAEYATKGNFNSEEFMAELYGENGLISAVSKFDITKQNEGWSLNGWINFILFKRKNDMFNRNVTNYNNISFSSEKGETLTKGLEAETPVEKEIAETPPSFRKQLEDINFPTFNKGDNFFKINSDQMMESGVVPNEVINNVDKWVNTGKGPKFLFLGGPPASGKSTAIKILKENISKLDNFEIINSDTYVEQAKKDAGLPENENNYTPDQRKARAKITVDGQKYLNKKLEDAIKKGKNIILDGTSASTNAVKNKIDKLLESDNYKPSDIAMLEVAGKLETAVQNNEYRYDRSLPTGIVVRTWLDYNKNKEERESLFKPYDFSKRVVSSSAKYIARNKDMDLSIDSNKARDKEYDKALEELGNTYYSEILKDLNKGEDYEKTLLDLKDAVDKLDPYILRKYNIDIYYEPIMTADGGSQKKVNNQLQWKERKPSKKEYLDYWLGVGKTKNTKGNRKQMLAKIIGAQVGIDGIVEATKIATINDGKVPIYNKQGEVTGDVDILPDKTGKEKIEIFETALVADVANKFRRDQNQEYSEVTRNRFKREFERASTLTEKLEVFEKYKSDIINVSDEDFYDETVQRLSQLLGGVEGVKASFETYDQELTRESANFNATVDNVNKMFKDNDVDIRLEARPLPGGKKSIWTLEYQGSMDANIKVEKVKENQALFFNSLPKDYLDKAMTEAEFTAGINKLKMLNGGVDRPSKDRLKDKPGENLLSKLLDTEITGDPSKTSNIDFELHSGSKAAGKLKDFELRKIFGSYKVPKMKIVDGKEVIKYTTTTAKTYEQAKEWRDKGYKIGGSKTNPENGYAFEYDLKPGDNLPYKAQIDLKNSVREKFEYTKPDGTKVDFDDIVKANKETVDMLLNTMLDNIDSFNGDPIKTQEYLQAITDLLRQQTNVGDGIFKGAFTITSISSQVPSRYETDSPTHAEHLNAMGSFSEQTLKMLADYVVNKDRGKSEEVINQIADASIQAIILREQQKIQDKDPVTGKSRQTTGSNVSSKATELETIEAEEYIEKSIDLTGDVNEVRSVLDKYIDEQFSKIDKDLADEFKKYDSKMKEIQDKIAIKDFEQLQEIMKEIKSDALDGKVDDINKYKDLKRKVNQYSEVAKESNLEEFNDIMKLKFGSKWPENKIEEGPAKQAGNAIDNKIFGKTGFGLRYSDMDFRTLLYELMPKNGTKSENEAAADFILNKLEEPYWDGVDKSISDGVYMANEVSSLLKSYDKNNSNKKLTEKVPGTEFTVDQAVRAYLYEKSEHTVPAVSNEQVKVLSDYVNENPSLKKLADDINKVGNGYVEPKENWMNGSIGSDFGDLYAKKQRDKYLEKWDENVDSIFTKEVLDKLRTIKGNDFVDNLENSIDRMKRGTNVQSSDKLSKFIQHAIINRTTGVTMFLNTRSALMQLISSMNYVNTTFNNPVKASAAIANQPQYWKDVVKLWKSDYLSARRNTQSIDISESELQAASSKGGIGGVIDLLLSKGYVMTKTSDGLAQALGGATWYRNYVKDLMKKDPTLDIEAAEVMADMEFPKISRRVQQSSDPALTSKNQTSLLGRSLLQYATTQQQYVRRAQQDLQDLLAGRGSWKQKVAGMINYVILQNAAYAVLINGVWTMAVDPTVSSEDKQKYYDAVNSILDGLLRGLGVFGSVIASGKNAVLKYEEEASKERPKYDKVKDVMLSTAPWIGQKNNLLNKASRALGYADTKKYKKTAGEEAFWDNPYLNAAASTTEAVFSIPLEELLRKFEAFDYMLDELNPAWKRIAVGLGYEPYQLDSEATKKAKADEESHDKRMKQRNMMKNETLEKVTPINKNVNNKKFYNIHN